MTKEMTNIADIFQKNSNGMAGWLSKADKNTIQYEISILMYIFFRGILVYVPISISFENKCNMRFKTL